MPDPTQFYFALPPAKRPPFAPLAEQMHERFEWLTLNRARARGRDVFSGIDTVVIHATAGFATQHAVDTWRQVKASAHWIVPDEDEPQHGNFVWATVAEAKAAFHVRDAIATASTVLGAGPNVNNRSLGIEVVNSQDVQNYQDGFSDWQVNATAAIVLYAWAKYPNLRHVISHAKLDPTRRGDPGRQFPWAAFQAAVLDQTALPQPNPLVAMRAAPRAPRAGMAGCCGP